MTDEHTVGSGEQPEPTGPVIRDRRRIDPLTRAVRGAEPTTTDSDDREVPMTAEQGHEAFEGDELDVQSEGDDSFGGAVGDALPGRNTGMPDSPFSEEEQARFDAEMKAQETRNEGGSPDAVLAAERLADLQRLQAEYVNYKKRVDRDKAVHRELGQASVLEALMPVLDEIHLARQHGDLDGGPFASIAGKLEDTLAKQGLVRYGEAGQAFDPNEHEALMHVQAELPEGADGTTIVQVLQPGYRLGERVIRPARVSVADPS